MYCSRAMQEQLPNNPCPCAHGISAPLHVTLNLKTVVCPPIILPIIPETYPRTIERMKIVVDLLWKNKTEPEDIIFQLAFKEIMASDICHGREEMGLFKKILSVEERL